MPSENSELRIYYYKMTADNGGAPCVRNRLLSLAICKPRIRRTAKVGDIIFGFAAKSLEPNDLNCRLIYIAEVTEKLCNGDYYKCEKYQSRPDCIYNYNNDGSYSWKLGSKYHSPKDIEHDLGTHKANYPNANVLMSKNFKYLGEIKAPHHESEFPLVYESINKISQGHRVNHEQYLRQELLRLKTRVWEDYPKTLKIGKPTNKILGNVCHYKNTQVGSC